MIALRAALALACVAAAVAFVPASPRAAARRSLQMDFAGGLIGSDKAEVGNWDPLNLAGGKSDETLAWYRAAELKHGRVSMLATTGYIVASYVHLPDTPFESTKPVDALIKVATERPFAAVQIGLAIAALEVLGASIQKYTAPGDLKWDPLSLKPEDEAEYEALQLKELKNGRLAMLAIAGEAVQEYVTSASALEPIKALF